MTINCGRTFVSKEQTTYSFNCARLGFCDHSSLLFMVIVDNIADTILKNSVANTMDISVEGKYFINSCIGKLVATPGGNVWIIVKDKRINPRHYKVVYIVDAIKNDGVFGIALRCI